MEPRPGHARSGDRTAIAAYLGEDDAFARAVSEFAERYADQYAHDHAALAEAARNGASTCRRDCACGHPAAPRPSIGFDIG